MNDLEKQEMMSSIVLMKTPPLGFRMPFTYGYYE